MTTQSVLDLDTSGIPEIPPPHDRPTIKYDDDKHLYWINGVRVPSVTTILDAVSAKGGLPWWGMRVGLGAVVKLMQLGHLTWPTLSAQVYEELLDGVPVNGPQVWRGKGRYRKLKTELEALVLEHKLDTNRVKDEAGDRGTLIHDAITSVGVDERLPSLDDFAPEHRGYIQAFCAWWLDQEPEFLRQEIISAHPALAYAGRWDLEARTHLGRCLWDFKTSKGVYPTFFEQLDLYELAEMALGNDPFDAKGIVHLRKDGTYAVYVSTNASHYAAECAVRLYHARAFNEAQMPKGYLDRD